jgi:hypothetical protein
MNKLISDDCQNVKESGHLLTHSGHSCVTGILLQLSVFHYFVGSASLCGRRISLCSLDFVQYRITRNSISSMFFFFFFF